MTTSPPGTDRTWRRDDGISFASKDHVVSQSLPSGDRAPSSPRSSAATGWLGAGNAVQSMSSRASAKPNRASGTTREATRTTGVVPTRTVRQYYTESSTSNSQSSAEFSNQNDSDAAYSEPDHDNSSADDHSPSGLLPQLDGLHIQDEESFVPTYEIPADVMEDALEAQPDSDDRFWSFRKYRDPNGKQPSLHYCRSLATAEREVAHFLSESVLGFDLEWEMWSVPTPDSIKRSVSVVQIASESKIVVIHLALFSGSSAKELMPPTLRKILSSEEYAKTGVNIAGDASRIRSCFGIEMKGLFELSHLYKQTKFGASEPSKVNRQAVNLAAQVEEILGLPLAKEGNIRKSHWSADLKGKQIDYAASDAYAGFQLYHALDDRRKQMDPTPERPAFYELQLPIPLPNGGHSEDESEPDSLDDEAPPTTKRRRSSTKPTTSPADQDDDQVNGDVLDMAATATEQTSSEEFERAKTWATSYRASLTESQRMLVKESELRAYHIWHVQVQDLPSTAAIMRTVNRPLAKSTVSGYVFRSIHHCRLPFDASRLEQIAQYLTIYDKRYGKLLLNETGK